MEKTLKIVLTNSYFNIFPLLTQELKGKTKDIRHKNLVFCEEKVSLMAERWICGELGGSFNTDVYSFGNFLRTKKHLPNALSKEGSAMAIKRVISTLNLKCFKGSKTYLAPTLYDLIAQLKSAKVSVEDLERATVNLSGVLKNKLTDVVEVYRAYEQFIGQRGYEDQSSALSYLPEVVYADKEIENADVYLLGYTSLTNQARAVIFALLNKAKSVTAILTQGENEFTFVNETVSSLTTLCMENGVKVERSFAPSEYTAEGELLINSAFNPIYKITKKLNTDKIYLGTFKDVDDEIMRVAEHIKGAVLSGECRWKDITVALASTEIYGDKLERAFDMLGIPYFLDEKKKVENHPLITLIISYIDAFRKNLESSALSSFYKNPLVCLDKDLADDFENYVIKYNVNYSAIKEPFKFEKDEARPLSELEDFRRYVCSLFDTFDVSKLLERLKADDVLSALSTQLKEAGEYEQSAVNEQIYLAVTKLLAEMNEILNGVKLPFAEYKNVFLSGVSAMDLSIIPQYSDAVFVGGFKETALAKAKRLFVCGMTSSVPAVKSDVALLSDKDIDALDGVSVLVEPKIRVVNHRARENAGMAISAFSERLYLSCPLSSIGVAKTVKSELFTLAEKLFTTKCFDSANGYMSVNQGVETFARSSGEYQSGELQDFILPSSFSQAVGEGVVSDLLDRANKQLKRKLDGGRKSMVGEYVSATTLETYHECPYKAFVRHGLKIKDREIGEVSNLSAGKFIHEIMMGYVQGISQVTDKASSDELVDKVVERTLKSSDYKKFSFGKDNGATLDRMINECRKYCFKTYSAYNESYFKSQTEVSFGADGKSTYPAIKLLDGSVKLKGVIDRVDIGENYYRVIDYKTGKSDETDASLFDGKKLQLYLYAKAVGETYKDKKLAGAYYVPINDKYVGANSNDKMTKGKTLSEADAITAQDGNFFASGKSEWLPISVDKNGAIKGASSSQVLQACMEYATKVSENAVKGMKDGVIVPSPLEGSCAYCEYKPLCGYYDVKERAVKKVDENVIVQATNGVTESDGGRE